MHHIKEFLLFLFIGLGMLMSSAKSECQELATLKKGETIEGITEYTLSNGLKILLLPDSSSPKVTVNMTVFVGSRHEGYGETGMAHLLEHMVFKGTPEFPNVPKALRDHGASFNGTTWLDRTNYFETMAATPENLEFGIHLESDRLVNSYVKREDLLSEMTVVRNEFESGENSPVRVLSQRMTAVAYEWHNYGKSTIGNRTDIERVPIENLQEFYRKYYRVDNVMLIIAGKFEEKKALDLIVKYFGKLKRGKEPIRNTYTEEPAQDGERSVTLRRVGTSGAVGVIYHIPSGAHPEFAPLSILEDCLTDSPTGRLYKALVKSKLATSLRGSTSPFHDPGYIEILAQVEPENIEKAKTVLIETIENLASSPISEEEVEQAKSRFSKQIEELLARPDRFAVFLSDYAACGDWRLFFLQRDRIEKVTAAEVNRVAKEYFKTTNRTTGVYYPTKIAERVPIAETPDIAAQLKGYKGKSAMVAGETFEATPQNIEKRLVRGKLESLQTALLKKSTRGETVNLHLNLRFGNEKSLVGQSAAIELLGTLMTRGTKSLTREQIHNEFNKLKATVSVSSSLGELGITIQTKKANLIPTLKIVEQILREPSFPENEFNDLKRQVRDRLNRNLTDPQQLAVISLRRKMSPYEPDNVRYVPTIEEQIRRLDSLQLKDIRNLYTTQIGAAVGELAIVGDFDPESTLETIGKMIKDWKAEVTYERIKRSVPASLKAETVIINTPDKANAVYLAGTVVEMNDNSPEYPAARIGSFLFGEAPLASRLSKRVRGEEGLSYGVGGFFNASAQDSVGTEMIYAITNPLNIKKVDAAIKDEINKFRESGLSLDELEQGKKAYQERRKLDYANDQLLTNRLTQYLYLNRTFQYDIEIEKKMDALTVTDVNQAFKKVIVPEKLIVVQAGDFKKTDSAPKKK